MDFCVVECGFDVFVDFVLYVLLFIGFGFGEDVDGYGVVGDLFYVGDGWFFDYYW